MKWDPAQETQLEYDARYAGDRYALRSEEMIQEAALAAISKL